MRGHGTNRSGVFNPIMVYVMVELNITLLKILWRDLKSPGSPAGAAGSPGRVQVDVREPSCGDGIKKILSAVRYSPVLKF